MFHVSFSAVYTVKIYGQIMDNLMIMSLKEGINDFILKIDDSIISFFMILSLKLKILELGVFSIKLMVQSCIRLFGRGEIRKVYTVLSVKHN